MGEHSVVYDRPAVVAGLGRRATIVAREAPGPGIITLSLPDLDWHEELDADELEAYRARFADLWARFAADPATRPFAGWRGKDPGHVVKIALGETARRLGRHPGRERGDVSVSVRSQIPVGSGFGSSAAVAAGTAAALLLLWDGRVDEPLLAEVTRESERRQHGFPSGVDGAAVLRGGFLFAEPAPDRLRIRSLDAAPGASQRVRVYDSGRPPDTTGEVVAGVRERVARSPGRFEAIFTRMGELTRAFAAALERPERDPRGLDSLVRDIHAFLDQLGVVPDGVRTAVADLEARGGAAKISGAGTLSEAGPAGCLIAFHDDPPVLDAWAEHHGLSTIHAKVGAGGWRVEPVDGQAA